MDDFESVYKVNTEELDYLKCKHCNERVERGICNVSHHWIHCLKRTDGLIVTKDPEMIKVLDSLSMNVK